MTGAGNDPPFARVAIVGLGLIGGSIALRVRREWPEATLVGVDPGDAASRAQAKRVVDEVRGSVRDLGDADLIVLAAPVPAIVNLLAEIGDARLRAIVTDVGSTKRQVAEAATRAGLPRFVGGHPMAGAERGGFEHASADLFDGRPWILVAEGQPATDQDGRERLEQFVARLGATPRRLSAAEHDRAIAYVSHLPQLLAVALMNTVAAGCGPDGLAAAGPALREMTRLAASPPELWRGIMATNGDFIAEALRALAERLTTAEADVRAGRPLEDAFDEAAAWRRRLDETPSR